MKDDERACPYCGESIKNVARKCRHCGEFLDGTMAVRETRAQPVSTITPPNIAVAYLLLLFFGMFGIHKFFIGNARSGFMYMAFTVLGAMTTWIGIGYVLWFIAFLGCIIDLFTLPGEIRSQYS